MEAPKTIPAVRETRPSWPWMPARVLGRSRIGATPLAGDRRATNDPRRAAEGLLAARAGTPAVRNVEVPRHMPSPRVLDAD